MISHAVVGCSFVVRVAGRRRRPPVGLLLVPALSPGRGKDVGGSHGRGAGLDQPDPVRGRVGLVDSSDHRDGPRRSDEIRTSPARLVQVLASNLSISAWILISVLLTF